MFEFLFDKFFKFFFIEILTLYTLEEKQKLNRFTNEN